VDYFFIFSHILFVLFLGFYLSINLQWYSYQLKRVIFNHARSTWHLLYFVIPILLYYGTKHFFWIFFYCIYVPYFYFWYKKLDKKIVFTNRIKRFFALLFVAVILQDLMCFLNCKCQIFGVVLALVVSFCVSFFYENMAKKYYVKKAARKLSKSRAMSIAITASFGKTSIKNYLHAFLKDDFKVQITPRSVNTDIGIAKEINENLQEDTEIFIAEAGARQRGDILKISNILGQKYAILGEVGEQHIEYFKTFDNVLATKKEILSKDLYCAFAHESSRLEKSEKIVIYSKLVSDVEASLQGTSWLLDLENEKIQLKTKVLGRFNAYNISAAFLLALKLGVSKEKLIKAVGNLKNVEHRLQKIEQNGKIIIDDSFNGNLQGMLEACELAKTYSGRKVIITPGIVESDKKSNEIFAKKVNEIFDLVIITGTTNMGILSNHILASKRIRLYDKSQLVPTLGKETRAGDLILFANDTPASNKL